MLIYCVGNGLSGLRVSLTYYKTTKKRSKWHQRIFWLLFEFFSYIVLFSYFLRHNSLQISNFSSYDVCKAMTTTIEVRYEFMAIAFASALLAVDDVVKIRGITKDMVEDMTPKRFVELANGTRNLERNNNSCRIKKT